jgi:transposase-like protein
VKLSDKGIVVFLRQDTFFPLEPIMPQIRYDAATQRRAAEQVLLHHRSVGLVARQFHCSPQSVKNWIERHHDAITTPPLTPSCTTFLPLQVEGASLVPPQIELVTKNGLTLRFSVETRLDTLLDIIQRLEVA